MFRVTVIAAEVQVCSRRFEALHNAEYYFEEQADNFFNDNGIQIRLEQRDEGCWITVKRAPGRRTHFRRPYENEQMEDLQGEVHDSSCVEDQPQGLSLHVNCDGGTNQPKMAIPPRP